MRSEIAGRMKQLMVASNGKAQSLRRGVLTERSMTDMEVAPLETEFGLDRGEVRVPEGTEDRDAALHRTVQDSLEQVSDLEGLVLKEAFGLEAGGGRRKRSLDFSSPHIQQLLDQGLRALRQGSRRQESPESE